MAIVDDIVEILLGETGEADQDYNHEPYDDIVRQLTAAGYPGGRHREFDKYQGVYIVVPGVDKFWTDFSGRVIMLMPENDPRSAETGDVEKIPVWPEATGINIDNLLGYIKDRYGAKFAQRKAQADAENFIDQSFWKKPRKGSTRPGV